MKRRYAYSIQAYLSSDIYRFTKVVILLVILYHVWYGFNVRLTDSIREIIDVKNWQRNYSVIQTVILGLFLTRELKDIFSITIYSKILDENEMRKCAMNAKSASCNWSSFSNYWHLYRLYIIFVFYTFIEIPLRELCTAQFSNDRVEISFSRQYGILPEFTWTVTWIEIL